MYHRVNASDVGASVDDSPAAFDSTRTSSPPYISFLTFLTLIDWLEREGVPLRFDRSFWETKFSGSKGAHLLTSLRFLDLINGSRVKPDLERLVASRGDARKSVLLEILRRSYTTVDFNQLERATPAMLGEWLDAYPIEGDTKRKAESFLINAVKHVGYPLSSSLRNKARIRHPRTSPRPNGKTATQESTGTQSARSRGGHQDAHRSVRTLKLESGGEVTLSLDVDLFDLSEGDRDFVVRLIDHFRTYVRTNGEVTEADCQDPTCTPLRSTRETSD